WRRSLKEEDGGELSDGRAPDMKRERVKEFLCSGLGVRRQADVLTVVEEVILPRLRDSKLPFEQAVRLTDYVRRNLAGYRGRVQRRAEGRTDPFRRIREGLRVKCYATGQTRRRRVEWRQPDGAYQGRQYTRSA